MCTPTADSLDLTSVVVRLPVLQYSTGRRDVTRELRTLRELVIGEKSAFGAKDIYYCIST